jgi:signal transduction histidine kinase
LEPFALSGLFAGISSAGFGTLVLARSQNRKLAHVWFLFALSVALWGFGVMSVTFLQDPHVVLLVWRIVYAFSANWIAVLFYHFVCIFSGLERRRSIHIQYGIAGLFFLSAFTPLFYADVRWVFGSFYYCKAGPLYLTGTLWWIALVGYSHYLLLRIYGSSSRAKKVQIKYFFLATAVGFAGGLFDFVPPLGFSLYPWGNFTITLYPLIMSYAIIRHRLMDIHLVSRNATGWLFAGLLSVLPFVISTLLAYFLATLPHFATSRSPGTLVCCILCFTLTLTLLNAYQSPHARGLFWFFVSLGCWNLTELFLDIRPSFLAMIGVGGAVIGYRLGYGIACIVPLTWFYLWDGYFHGENPSRELASRIITWASLAVAPVAGLTPGVLKTLIFEAQGRRPAVEVPGSLYWVFVAWFMLMVAATGCWATAAWWRSKVKPKYLGAWMFGAFVTAPLAATAYFLFVKDVLRGYWFSPLEAVMCLFLMGAMFWRMPPERTRTQWAVRLVGFEVGILVVCGLTGWLISRGTPGLSALGGLIGGASLVTLFLLIRRPIQYWVDISFFAKEYGHVAAYEKLARELKLSDSLYEALAAVSGAILMPGPEIAVYKSVCAIVTFEDVEAKPCFSAVRIRTTTGEMIIGDTWKEELQRELVHLVRSKDDIVVREEQEDLPPLIQAMDHWLFAAAAPLKVEGETVGAIIIGQKGQKGSSFHQKDAELLTKLADQVNGQLSPIVRLNRMNWLVNKVIHDEAGQKLSTIQMKLEIGEPLLKSDEERLASMGKSLAKLRDHANTSLSRGRPSPKDLKAVDVAAELQGLRDNFLPLAKRKDLELVLDIRGPLPPLLLREPSYLERCIGNFITNAVKYTAKGRITISARGQGEHLVIAVADTGIGIPKEAIPRLFEEGYRVPGSAAAMADGTGVGLSNVRELVLAMGGKVEVESEVGKGSTFSMFIPIPLGANIRSVDEVKVA